MSRIYARDGIYYSSTIKRQNPIQIVVGLASSSIQTTSSTYQTTGCSATISVQPGNWVLVNFDAVAGVYSTNAVGMQTTIYKNGVDLGAWPAQSYGNGVNASIVEAAGQSLSYIDKSGVGGTYEVFFKCSTGASSYWVQMFDQERTITLMEIPAP